MDEDVSRGFGRLEALLELNAKESREGREATGKRFDGLENQFGHMRAAMTKLESRVSATEGMVKKASEDARKSASDLSDHISQDADTNVAIAKHMKSLEEGVGRIAKDNKLQTTDVSQIKHETEAQTPLLESVNKRSRAMPYIITVVGLLGTFAGHLLYEFLKSALPQ